MGRSCARVVQPQDFTVDNMTITLNSEFREADYEGFTKCYESYNMGVSVLKESFSQYPILEDYTLEEYGDAVMWANGLTDSSLTPYADFMYFTYTSTDDAGNTFGYLATVHQSNDAFWLIQFSTLEEKDPDYERQFLHWADSVKFD